MYILDLCRICLTASIEKDIRQLKICENDSNESYVGILLFCLDIQIMEDSAAFSTKLCGKCYETILTYHKFKTLALKNDHYLKTIKQSTVKLEPITINDWKHEENGDTEQTNFDSELYYIKDESESVLQTDNSNIEFQNNSEVNVENVNFESDDDYQLSSVTKPTEVRDVETPINEIQNNSEVNVENVNFESDDDYPLSSVSTPTEVGAEETPINEIQSNSEVNVKNVNFESDDDYPLSRVTTATELGAEETPINQNQKSVKRHSKCDDDILSVIKPMKVQMNQHPINERKKTLRGNSKSELSVIKLMKAQKNPLPINEKKLILKGNSKLIFIKPIKIQKNQNTITTNMKSSKASIKNYNQTKQIKEKNLQSGKQVCLECGGSFACIAQHRQKHLPREERTSYPCIECDKIFYTSSGRFKHYRDVHLAPKSIQCCDICGKKVLDIQMHKVYVHNADPAKLKYVCEFCGLRCITNHRLQVHLECHGDRPYRCELCHERFNQHINLKRHIRGVHKKERSLICQFCSKGFSRRHQLSQHIRNKHTKETTSKCEVCGKGFAAGYILKKHMETHNPQREKNFHCDHCDKKFYTRQQIETHLVIHSQVKKYACQFCGKRFRREIYRKTHELIHTQVKKYPCRYCGKLFSRSDNRKTHEVVHTDVKKYKCHYCSKHFNRSDNRKAHERKMHEKLSKSPKRKAS